MDDGRGFWGGYFFGLTGSEKGVKLWDKSKIKGKRYLISEQ